MIKKCKTCGKGFLTKDKRKKFCSWRCYCFWLSKNRIGKNNLQWKGGKIKCICEICGRGFKIKACVIKIGKGKLCSRKCYGIWKSINQKGRNNVNWKEKAIKKCHLCGKDFSKNPSKIKRMKFCSHSCASIWKMANCKKQETSIEIKMEQELTRRGIVFQKQYPIWQAKTIPDFFIPPNICIYCDGDYWHNLPKQKARDSQQDFMLKFLEYKVYRFWEHEIKKDVSKCVLKIIKQEEVGA